MRRVFTVVFLVVYLATTYLSSIVVFGEEQLWLDTTRTMTSGEILHELGLINGDLEGRLHEDEFITRGEMIAVINRMKIQMNSGYTISNKQRFSDVPVTHWAFVDIEKAYSDGITKGLGDGTFGINDSVTYQQAYAFLLRVIGEETEYNKVYLRFNELNLLEDLYTPGMGQPIKRGDLFTLMIRSLLYEKTSMKHIEQLTMDSDKRELFIKRTMNDHVMGNARYYSFPNIESMNFDNVDIYEGAQYFFNERLDYQEMAKDYYPLFYKQSDYMRLDVNQVFTMLKADNNIDFESNTCAFYDDEVPDEEKSIINFSSNFSLSKEGHLTSSTNSSMGYNSESYENSNFFLGHEVTYNNNLVTPLLIVSNKNQFNLFILLLINDSKVQEGIILSRVGGKIDSIILD